MPISRDQINATIKEYLLRYPDEVGRLEPLTTTMATATANATSAADEPTSRRSLPGHVTVNAVLLDAQNRVLHIHHLALDRWLTPGGHCEPEDSSLVGAALRELQEETGIPPESVQPVPEFAGQPIDIDVHAIPANSAKDEPGHWHYDFRFVFRATAGVDVGQLQAEEVTDAAWLPAAHITPPECASKVALSISSVL